MKTNTKVLGTLAIVGALGVATLFGQAQSVQPSAIGDKELCQNQLETIYQAVHAYRREHKDLPNWLTDLVPNYIADTNVLICPVTKRTGQTHTFEHLKDPRLPAAYLYEFCPLPMGQVWGGGQVRMRDFKRRQMGLVGGEVPIVRCHLHQPVLNLAFSGRVYESPMNWEENFAEVVDFSASSMARLFPEVPPVSPSARQPIPRVDLPAENDLTGKPAPEFTLPLLDGGTFELAAHREKDIVLLDFWATWCGPCRVAMPVLVEVAREYADRGVRYFAVNLQEAPEKIQSYLKNSGLNLAVPLDQDGSVARQYGVRGIPTMVIVGKDGVVRKVHVGSSPGLKADLTRALEALINGEKASDETSAPPHPKVAIPPRPEDATPEMVDLSSHFHAALTETWHPGAEGNDLAQLPAGVQSFQGVRFDVRGIVQLNSRGMIDRKGKAYPQRVQDISIGRKCARFHFLHSTGWAVPDGTLIGSYVLNYRDGSSRTLPIVYGQDVRDWWFREVLETSNGQVAWQGQPRMATTCSFIVALGRILPLTWKSSALSSPRR